MNKIPAEILSKCTAETCLQNEIAILPANGDAGFEEYFFYKAEEMKKRKHLFTKMEKTALLLSYPSPPDEKGDRRFSEMLFERFFASPMILAGSQVFCGCFGIDISAYLSETTNNKLLDLMAYIRNTPETTYVLFAYTNNVNEADSLISAVNQYADFVPVRFSLPDAARLSEYICGGLRGDESVRKSIYEAVKDLKLGYDSADYLIKYLKSRNGSGDPEDIKAQIPDAIDSLQINSRNDSFGY